MKKHLPDEIKGLIKGYHMVRVTTGQSQARVYHLTCQNKPSLYLKIFPINSFNRFLELGIEAKVLDWLNDMLPVPKKHSYVIHKNKEFLLITEIPGINIADAVNKCHTKVLIYLLAKGLKAIHSTSITNCPFSHTINDEIEIIKNSIANGLVDETDFDEERQGRTALELFDELINNKPLSEDLVFTHGDYCLPNIVINNGGVSGFIDLSRAGIGDRYRDLALAARSIAYNINADWIEPFFTFYGIDQIDFNKINYYQLLDEFF